jgi:hypothetical protein
VLRGDNFLYNCGAAGLSLTVLKGTTAHINVNTIAVHKSIIILYGNIQEILKRKHDP